MDSRPSFSCVAGYIDRPEIILRSLKLKNNIDNDDENSDIEHIDKVKGEIKNWSRNKNKNGNEI